MRVSRRRRGRSRLSNSRVFSRVSRDLPPRVVIGLHVEWRGRRNQDGAGDSPAAVAGQISNNFRRTQGVANEDDVLQVKSIEDGGDIVRKRVEIVSLARIILSVRDRAGRK